MVPNYSFLVVEKMLLWRTRKLFFLSLFSFALSSSKAQRVALINLLEDFFQGIKERISRKGKRKQEEETRMHGNAYRGLDLDVEILTTTLGGGAFTVPILQTELRGEKELTKVTVVVTIVWCVYTGPRTHDLREADLILSL